MKKWRNYLVDRLKKNPNEAISYLNVALEEFEKDQNLDAFLLSLRTVIKIQGGVSSLAKKTDLNREHLYRLLSSKGNPTLFSLLKILGALGYHLKIESEEKLAA